jgi:propanediol dehydratase small subunit
MHPGVRFTLFFNLRWRRAMPEYPLAQSAPELVRSPRGTGLEDITLDAVLRGEVTMEDLRITATALEAQAAIAGQAGRPQLAENLMRASELVDIPDDVILSTYNALRPGRSTRAELERLANILEREYDARRSADLVREAALVR